MQFRYTLKVRSAGFILANTRRVLNHFDWYDREVTQEEPIEHFFEDEITQTMGRDARAEMIRTGQNPEDYINASEVADYLADKGQFYYDGQTIEMALTVPGSRQTKPTKRPVASRSVVKINVQTLIERLSAVAICMGDIVGYPKAMLNSAIVASAVRMVD